MSHPRLPETKSTDEIDLRELVRRIKNLFSRFFSFIGYVLRLIIRGWVFFLLCCAVGAAVAYAYFITIRPYYAYSMTALVSEVRTDLVEDQIHNLELLVNDDNRAELARQLGVSVANAQSIKSISYFNLDQTSELKDSVQESYAFEVNVELFNNSIQDSVQDGIVNYLENNPYLAKQMQVKKEHLASIVAKLKEDIRSIDSQKVAALNLQGPANGFVYGQPLDPSTLYKESVLMLERQTALEATLKRLKYIDVVVSFAPKIHPTGPKLKKYLVVGVILAFLLALVSALYLDRRKALSA